MSAGVQNFDVHFHILMEDGTVEGGNIPSVRSSNNENLYLMDHTPLPSPGRDVAVAQQMTVLNNAYSGSNVAFALVDTTRIVNPEILSYAAHLNQYQDEMKSMLRVGDASTLNV